MSDAVPYIVATAGHVDHGKTALVRALTGTDTDRLPQEKARGISIELGFAHLDLAAAAGAAADAPRYDVGLVDVPGHEDFIKNMVAGVGSVDAALLVVAADDGWMPQTEEHLQILTYLGVAHGVVALTKADLAADVDAAVAAVRERLRGTPFEAARVVPTSVKDGRGMAELRSALAAALSATPPQRDVDKPRLAVDRAFLMRGVGTVVTGTLTGGTLRRGQEVVVRPGGAAARVRTVQTHGNDVEAARPGSRVALNLPDLAVDPPRGPRSVTRGDVVTVEELGVPVRGLDVLLDRSARARGTDPRDGTRVWVHHGSGATPARVRLSGTSTLAPGGRCVARLSLDAPAFVLTGDRVVLREWSARDTLAGGLVLDVGPSRDREAQRAMIAARAARPGDTATYLASQLTRDRVVERVAVLVRSRFAAHDVRAAIDDLLARGEAVRAGAWLVEADAWRAALAATAAAVDAHHRARPEHAGLPLPDARRAAPWRDAPADVGDALVDALCQAGFERRGPAVARAHHRPALPPRLEPAGRRIEAVLRDHPLDPPSRKELAPTDVAAQALKFLIASGHVVELGTDVVLAATTYHAARARVRDLLAREGAATVSQIKTALGSSRRIVVPLVERLDRDGVTLRRGDLRVLRER